MSDHSSTPSIERALIVFVKYPEPGRVKTRLAADIGADEAARIYSRLALRQIGEAVAATDAPPFVFFDPAERDGEVEQWLAEYDGRIALAAQMEGSLGERMHAAFRRIFSRNETRRAVIIGTDCPGLDAARIGEAFVALDAHDLVLGPAADGGYYLLGMRTLLPWVFEGMPWSTDRVLSATLDAAAAHGTRVGLLGELRDVDTVADLKALLPEWLTD
jgi:uncharacterized protein